MTDVMIPRQAARSFSSPRTARITAMDRHVGARVRGARVARNMTMGMLGDAIGVSTGQIEKYERADNAMSPGRLHAIARALNVLPAWFFEDFEADASVPYERPEFRDPEAEEALDMAKTIQALPIAQRRIVKDMLQQFGALAREDAGVAAAAAE